MTRLRLALVCASLIAAAVPASASATTTALPSSLSFGQTAVGSTTATQQVTLSVKCTNYIGFPVDTCITGPFDAFSPNPVTVGEFTATSNCPGNIPVSGNTTTSCTINVAFKPTSTGPKTGTLNTGTTAFLSPGPTVSLSGTGTAAQNQGQNSTTPGTTTGGKKKCKKKGKGKKKGCKKRKK